MWWNIRSWLAEGGALPPDAKRDEELLAPTYGFDGEGRTLVESKDVVRNIEVLAKPALLPASCG